MDIHMPILNGIEATIMINKKIQNHDIPPTTVIALSAGQLTANEENLYFKEAGFAAYVGKPVPKESFLKILKTYGVIQ